MKKIEVLMNFRSRGWQYYAGEVRFVTPEAAERFCKAGWAKDVSGELKTGTPDLSEKTLEVQDGKHPSGASNVGVKSNG